jgi:hypothetical protein
MLEEMKTTNQRAERIPCYFYLRDKKIANTNPRESAYGDFFRSI